MGRGGGAPRGAGVGRWAGRVPFPESGTTERWLRRLRDETGVKPSSSTTGGAGAEAEEAVAELEAGGWGTGRPASPCFPRGGRWGRGAGGGGEAEARFGTGEPSARTGGAGAPPRLAAFTGSPGEETLEPVLDSDNRRLLLSPSDAAETAGEAALRAGGEEGAERAGGFATAGADTPAGRGIREVAEVRRA